MTPAGPPPRGEESWHPPVETLSAHLRGELAAAEADRVREHLTGCGECIDRLLDLDAFEGPAAEPASRAAADPAAAEAERAESWRRLLAERPWDEPAAGAEPPAPSAAAAPAPPLPPPSGPLAFSRPGSGRRSRPRRLSWRTGLVAASLAAAALSGLWSLHLHHLLTAPEPDHPVIDLMPEGVTRGEGRNADGFPVPPGSSFTTLIVPEAEGPFESYRVDLVDAAGDVVWSGTLRPGDPAAPYPSLSLGLSRRMLPERRYTLRLWGIDAGRRIEAGVYRLEFAR